MTPSGKAVFTFGDEPTVSPKRLVEFVKERGATFTPDRKLYVDAGDLEGLLKVLEELSK